MITRNVQTHIHDLLQRFPAVGILGPRQMGKTTLAHAIVAQFEPEPIYLDLESPSDLAKLQEPELYFEEHADRLIILDEIQQAPEIFRVLRGIIDRRRRAGMKSCQFLILGSASLELLQQSSESLAGRIAYVELSGLTIFEVATLFPNSDNQLWLRGGFPDSFLAHSNEGSMEWRLEFIKTYLERDIPQFGPRIPATQLRRFWTMLAHTQGSPFNAAPLATSLAISTPTVYRYLDLLVDLLLVRRLAPWSNNQGKRLVKSPKVYIRDSGIVHALLRISDLDELLGHPVVGNSWEGFVIENLLAALPKTALVYFYRTSAGAEIDLLLDISNKIRVAVEIKHSLTPYISKGFHIGCEDVDATHRYVVYPGKARFQIAKNVEAISLLDLVTEIST
jgi:predicted AAA+ superfamily ATPase